MRKKEFLVRNLTGMDFRLQDIKCRVPARQVVDLYKLNPKLTEEEINLCVAAGTLKEKVKAGLLMLVRHNTPEPPVVLKESGESVFKAFKVKSSVIIRPTDILETGEEFEFADYGVDEELLQKKEPEAPAVWQPTEVRSEGTGVVVENHQPEEVVAEAKAPEPEAVSVTIGSSMLSLNAEPVEASEPVEAQPEEVVQPVVKKAKVKRTKKSKAVETEFDVKVATEIDSENVMVELKED